MKVLLFPIVAICVAVIYSVADSWWRNLEDARLPSRQMRAALLAKELVQTTNSATLAGTGPEFRAELSRVLAAPTWPRLAAGRRGTIRLILTNSSHAGLEMRLRDDYPSGFLLLGYRRTTEPDGAANRSQPVGLQTNRASAAAGPGG